MSIRFVANVTMPLYVGAPAQVHPFWRQDTVANPGHEGRDNAGGQFVAGELATFRPEQEQTLVDLGLAVFA